MAISTKILHGSFSLNFPQSSPQRIPSQITDLNLRTHELMKSVLVCNDDRSFASVVADIDICIKQIEGISKNLERLWRRNPSHPRGIERIDLLFTNIYLVRHHALRLREFSELRGKFNQLQSKIVEYDRHSKFSFPSSRKEVIREFRELDLFFFAIKEGLTIRPLRDCQKERFASLTRKHTTLCYFIKALHETGKSSFDVQENIFRPT